MPIIRKPDWAIGESAVTDEVFALGRRRVLAGSAAAVSLLAAVRAHAAEGDPAWAAKPAARNAGFNPGRAMTPEKDATTYNNYYEFSEGKDLWRAAQKFPTRPRTITIDGMVKNTMTLDTDDLIAKMPVEERVYRHRCVERWAMTVPWTGFSLAALVRMAEPLGSAKYVRFETVQDKKTMPGLRNSLYPWPYVEGLAIDEAMNDLAFISVGMYGKPLPPQNGGPIRLTLPWKYGFKSGKSLTRVSFVEKRPVGTWEEINPGEYGFWANVNPAVAHPRWSQASERLLGSDEQVPTQIYNGYGAQVASLYASRSSEKLFM